MASLATYVAMRDGLIAWRGDEKKRPILVRLATGGILELRNDVPATRAECPTKRPCGHVRCEWHLWFQHGEERPGRRWAGKPPPSTLRPAWLEVPLPPSCGADILERAHADGEDLRVDDAAAALGIKRTRFREILQAAKRKVKAKKKAKAKAIASESPVVIRRRTKTSGGAP